MIVTVPKPSKILIGGGRPHTSETRVIDASSLFDDVTGQRLDVNVFPLLTFVCSFSLTVFQKHFSNKQKSDFVSFVDLEGCVGSFTGSTSLTLTS